MRRSASPVATALALAALALSACGDGDEDESTADGAGTLGAAGEQPASPVAKQFSSADASSDVYEGNLSIDVDYYGYDCQTLDPTLRLEGSRTYEMPVQVIRGPPAEAGGIRESSPYNLIVGADPGNEAGIGTVSATVAQEPGDIPVLFEYWRMDVQGSNVQGELVNSWRSAGLVLNIFPTDRLLVPCRPELGMIPRSIQPIEEGARLEGSITDENAELTITGQTLDHERRFTGRITAARTP
jgi:hypothetical protein